MPSEFDITVVGQPGMLPAPLDDTVDCGQNGEAKSGSFSGRAARGFVALIEGSGPHLSGETRDVLRRRLRIAALLFFVGFSAFLPQWFFYPEALASAEHRWVFYTHCAVTALLGLLALGLCQKCDYSLTKLRVVEALVFGDPALFFVVLGYHKIVTWMNFAGGASHLPLVVAPWLLLIFTYALFIPNTWRRALLGTGLMAVAPIAILVYLRLTSATFQELMSLPQYQGYITEQAMELALAVLVATVGVHTIGTLRREAFAARQLGQYRLKRLIGTGGMGEVYLAEHQMMKRPCAVKLIRPEKAGDPQVMARFEREVRATAKLSHWNSIDIFDYGRTADGTFYYVMEYLPGHNIGEMVEAYGPLPAGRLVHLMRQVCSALAEAHGIGLIHRDIKPANIFCAYRGGEFDVAKLLDFGLAKPTVEKMTDAALTQEGAITGSPLYMAPEQATGNGDVDARSDIYSLGGVMYFALTGEPPFNLTNALQVMVAHATQAVRPLREKNSLIPEELEEIVLRCLEKDPEDRFQTVLALRDALEDVVTDEPWSARLAAEWWSCNGCPERKRLAAEAVEAAAV
jgi:serine/threonine-protein kinase